MSPMLRDVTVSGHTSSGYMYTWCVPSNKSCVNGHKAREEEPNPGLPHGVVGRFVQMPCQLREKHSSGRSIATA